MSALRTILTATVLAITLPANLLAQDAPAPIEVALEAPQYAIGKGAGSTTTISISGRARLPDEAVLRVSVGLTGRNGRAESVAVSRGAFRTVIDFGKSKLLPGSYRIRAEMAFAEQLPSVQEQLKGARIAQGETELMVGTPEEYEQERDRLRKAYRDMLNNLRMLYLNLQMWGSFTNAKALKFRIEGMGKVEEREGRVVWDDWSSFSSDTWSRVYPIARHDFMSMTNYVAMSYFPETEEAIRGILDGLDSLQALYSALILSNIGREVTPEIMEKASKAGSDSADRIQSLAASAYRELGLEGPAWRAIDLGSLEDPKDIHGDTFSSTKSKFEIEKPKDWNFDFIRVNPNVRIRLLPKDEKLVVEIVAGVEIHDFPAAESFQDLARQFEANTKNSQPSYQEVKREDLKVPDETMPNGERPGLLLIFKVTEGQYSYEIRQYTLFCRWHKRVYTFLGICPVENYAKWEPTLNKISESFKVLDDPKLLEKGPTWVDDPPGGEGKLEGHGEAGGGTGGEAK